MSVIPKICRQENTKTRLLTLACFSEHITTNCLSPLYSVDDVGEIFGFWDTVFCPSVNKKYSKLNELYLLHILPISSGYYPCNNFWYYTAMMSQLIFQRVLLKWHKGFFLHLKGYQKGFIDTKGVKTWYNKENFIILKVTFLFKSFHFLFHCKSPGIYQILQLLFHHRY